MIFLEGGVDLDREELLEQWAQVVREAESTIQVETVAVDRNTDHFTQRNMKEYMITDAGEWEGVGTGGSPLLMALSLR